MSVSRDTTTSHDITTDASFRAWAQAIHDRLAAVGMIQTSDTGQINLSTVTTPVANNTSAGYEVWRFNDAAQGSDPIYFRIDYGRGGAASRPRMLLTLGSGSNGSGTITGTTMTDADANPQSSQMAPAGTTGVGTIHAASDDGSKLLLACQANTSTVTSSSGNGYGMVIERIRNSTDNSLKGGAICLVAWGNSSFQGVGHCSKDADGVHTASTFSGGWVIPTRDSSAVSGADTWIGIGYPMTHRPEAPLTALAVARPVDFTHDDTGVITIMGGTRAYRAFGGVSGGLFGIQNSGANEYKLLLLNQ